MRTYKKMGRRKFLKASGTAVLTASFANGPLSILLESLTRGAVGRAYAETTGVPSRRWVDMRFDAAPPRWVYDLFLKNVAADNTNFVTPTTNDTIATRYTLANGVATGGSYDTVSLAINNGTSTRTVLAPYLWSLDVPAKGGGTRPMRDLLKHFLHVRGITTGNPGHPGSRALHYQPLGAIQSLSALAADGSDTPIAAVMYGAADFSFRSQTAKSPFPLAKGNLVRSLMSPFFPSSTVTNTRTREAQVQAYVDAARDRLEAQALLRHPDSAAVKESVAGARKLITELAMQSLSDLDTVWTDLLAKYSALVSQALDMSILIPGINDKPIGVSTTRGPEYNVNQAQEKTTNADLRTMITSTTNITNLAESFAITEFILLKGYSNSITLGIPGWENLAVHIGSTLQTSVTFDEHFVGGMVSLLLNSLMARAHAACMLELIDSIGPIFNDTIINVGAEFNRKPNTNGVGSDHSSTGASIAVYSGLIDGPHILGDIAKDSQPTNFKGTFGDGLNQSTGKAAYVLDGSMIDLGNMAATIAQLLGVKSPVTARETLLYVMSGNKINPRLDPGKIVG